MKSPLILLMIVASLIFTSCYSVEKSKFELTYNFYYPGEKIVFSEIIESTDSLFTVKYNPCNGGGYYSVEDSEGRFYRKDKYPIMIINIEKIK